MTMEVDLDVNKCGDHPGGVGDSSPGCSSYSGMVHSKKVIKHALRQQAKRRRKNTTIAAGNSRTLPRIVVKPLPPPPPDDEPPTNVVTAQRNSSCTSEEPAATMREVLASLPGFSLKSSRRRSTKRLSAAAQLEAGLVDLESPASILANTSLRALLNRHTFQGLPPLYQRKLAQLLPAVDRQDAATSGLNNEFFARACLEWRKRLAEGEFTPENQQRLKMEAERDKNKLDPWKLKHFEPIWGEKRDPKLRSGPHCAVEPRSAGAVTRSSLRLRLESANDQIVPEVMACQVSVSACEKLDVENSVTVTKERINVVDNETTLESEPIEKSAAVIEKICEEESEEVLANRRPESPMDSSLIKIDPETPSIETVSSRVVDENNEEDDDDEDDEEIVTDLAVIDTCRTDEVNNEEVVCKIDEQNVTENLEEDIPIVSETLEQENCETEIEPTTQDLSTVDDTNPKVCSVIDGQTETEERTESTTTVDGEPQIPEVMEIDSETLRHIHELEVRGEMREVYEEISGCPENIYPILESMEIGSSTGGEGEESAVPVRVDTSVDPVPCEITTGNEDDAFIDANNYVLESREIRAEMLECNWTVESNNVGVGVASTHEELQVPWPLVAAALDGSVAANITVTTQDECNDSPNTSNDIENVVQRSVVKGTNPGQQIQTDQQSSDYRTSSDAPTTPVVNPVTQSACNIIGSNAESPPIIAFPQLQSIRFVQTNFNTSGQQTNDNNSLPIQIQNQINPSQQQPQQQQQQLNVISNQDDNIVQISSANVLVGRNNLQNGNNNNNSIIHRSQTQTNTQLCVNSNNNQQTQRGQGTIVVQQQNNVVTNQQRQIVTAAPVQQQYPTTVVAAAAAAAAAAASSRSARSAGQGGQRGSRSGNKEQGGGRSRSSTKEPPGAVNLERSYQICQAVIQSSPNRDQLKAHLKPPPSLLARAEGTFTTSKSGGRSLTGVKNHKSQQPVQHVKHQTNKGQAVMLRHVFATARQAIPTEVTENGGTVSQLGQNGGNGLGQYILVQRTGVGDGAPRASSAPPLPPHIAGMGVGLHLVRGRPASAGEGSHQAVTLKARGASDGRGGGGAEPGAPGVIMGGDPPPPCECNMRGAMVICRQCGAFCHDDCIGPQRICATCLIR